MSPLLARLVVFGLLAGDLVTVELLERQVARARAEFAPAAAVPLRVPETRHRIELIDGHPMLVIDSPDGTTTVTRWPGEELTINKESP